MTSSESETDTEAEMVWSKLKTQNTLNGSTYDKNNQLALTKFKPASVDENDGSGRLVFPAYSPSVKASLLVQSLIGSICYYFEKDRIRARDLTQELCKKLWELNMIDNSYQRPEFEGIRLQYAAALESLFKLIKEAPLPVMNLDAVPLNTDTLSSLDWSRYYTDFTEIEKISQGGFGEVFKAQHKIDRNIYAIKKILITSEQVNKVLSHFREVNTFASLDHLNVVAYKSCWLEPMIFYQSDKKIVQDDSSMSSFSSEDHVRVTKSKNSSLRLQDDSSFTVEFAEDSEAHVEKHEEENYEKSVTVSQMEVIKKSENGDVMIPHVKLAWSMLYIQMKLCQQTLRNFLDERNSSQNFQTYYTAQKLTGDNETVIALNIFSQICSGLEYIHNKQIVHHDLKPSNVFISYDYDAPIFQLGDFGLACPLEGGQIDKHVGVGTRLYAAKEQIEGRICTKKSDIYSLGIIFIELISKCSTFMECAKKVDLIKKGKFVDDIDPKLCHLISELLNVKHEERPTISELRQEIKQLIEDDEISKLKNLIEFKDKEIESKDKQIEELIGEIQKLKKQISNEN